MGEGLSRGEKCIFRLKKESSAVILPVSREQFCFQVQRFAPRSNLTWRAASSPSVKGGIAMVSWDDLYKLAEFVVQLATLAVMYLTYKKK